ncbi:MAG: alanine--tRNA ligase [Chloroflexota bacterium]|nr:alanine--tRNA ligase [Chloroflexota bacterium]MDE2683552.1 alanine--tRNA ligase [Chloroflexota bacterium]
MDGDSIRSSFIRFFEEREHLHMPSASLIPAGDPTLLFTSAGMVPFKPFFMGEQTPPRRRLTSCQKSFRTTDIDEVGDHKHLTFFEMLGNFSIGDYFKQDAVAFAWDLCTGLFGLEPERMYVTVHLDDDQAYDIWHKEIGIPPERIYRYGNSDNWWGPAGLEGPTGPCSELHYDGGAEKGIGQHRDTDEMMPPDELTALLRREADEGIPADPGGCHPNCDCERFVELWNLVFMQFYQDLDGVRTPLPAPSVDTGMGLERAAAVLQNKPNVYETDLFRPIIDAVCRLTGREYGADAETDYALRVVAEHARAASVLISDGVVPSNSERGYVLRRIIRRAIRYGRQLGLDGPFMTEVASAVIDRFAAAYPALDENRDFIRRVVGIEEERFAETFERGNNILRNILTTTPPEDLQLISGNDAFVLYDTYGFPPELVDEIGRREYGLSVDMDGFNAEMEAKRERDRAGHQVTGSMEIVTAYENLGAGNTAFDGYYQTSIESRILGILRDGEAVGQATRGQQVEIVLAETCFYAEGGGQVGDTGIITGPNGRVQVEDTQSPVAGLIVHRGKVVEGDIALGDAVTGQVEAERRLDASRNHSGTHLLHAALRSILGPHVRQAGSLCDTGRLRFDFNHVGAMTSDEQLAVQSLANGKIRENLAVTAHETTYADAVREGALAFFGDRYGDVVRVVRMADSDSDANGHGQADPFSFEVCGGTHVHATGQVGTLVVLGESSIGGGMRRIEAITGRAAEELVVQQSATLQAISQKLQAPVHELEARLDAYMADTDALRRRLADTERVGLRAEAESLLGRVRDVDGVKLVASVTSANNVESMREMGDYLKQKLDSVVIALGAVIDGSPMIVTMVTPDLVGRGLHAGNIARDSAKLMGGGGGGRPETAQAGGRQPDRLGAALDAVSGLVRDGLKG